MTTVQRLQKITGSTAVCEVLAIMIMSPRREDTMQLKYAVSDDLPANDLHTIMARA